jgi:cysteine desulfurase
VPLLLDAVQAVGKIPVDFKATGAAALAFGAHKFHGPRGIGGLLLRRGIKLPSLLSGGHQESGRRAGTEAVPLIAGMAKALELWRDEVTARTDTMRSLRDQLQRELLRRCPPAVIHAKNAERLPNTLSIAFPGVPGEALLVNLHLAGVACSLGSTCASGSMEPAKALLAMGVEPEICKSSVRFSISCQNTVAEMDDAAERISTVVTRMRNEKVEKP